MRGLCGTISAKARSINCKPYSMKRRPLEVQRLSRLAKSFLAGAETAKVLSMEIVRLSIGEHQHGIFRRMKSSPLARTRTSAVLGTTSALNSTSIRPLGDPPMVISRKTTGLSLMVMADLSPMCEGSRSIKNCVTSFYYLLHSR